MKLFITLIAAFALTACGQAEKSENKSADVEEMTGEVITNGAFSGLSDHVTTGDVTIREAADGVYVVLEKNFSLDGAPDPTLGFGNGDFIPETQFSALNSKQGYQTYKLPADLDPTEYSQIYVWCEEFAVPLGVAAINQ